MAKYDVALSVQTQLQFHVRARALSRTHGRKHKRIYTNIHSLTLIHLLTETSKS